MASYEQNKNSKLWSVRFRDITADGVKNMRLSGFKTKKDAQAGYIDYVNNKEHNTALPVSSSTSDELLFSGLIRHYLEHTQTRVKASSYYDIESKILKHIMPYFENKRVCDVTPLDILNWQQTVDSYSYKYKSGLRTFLTSIYKFGERYYDIKNIMPKVEPFRNLEKKKKMLFWTLEEFNSFISCVSDFEFNVFFRLLYITGCRKGEALALEWSDIDFKKRTVSITKSLTRKESGKAYAITTPKNASSNREVDIPESLCNLLSELKEQQEESNFVFGGEKPFAERTIDRRFASAIELSGVPKIRIHDLRHSCASLLISQGISIVAVSNRLGHSNIEQTLNTYSHMMPSDATKIVEIFDNI